MSTSSLPNLAELLGPVLQRISTAERPLVIAAAERMAADRYRQWSMQVKDESMKSSLLACAVREDQVARLVEGLFDNAATRQQALLLQTPELTDSSRSVFAGLPLTDQFKLQAQGERTGAATWRSYAKHANSDSIRDVYLQCALLEEASAIYLESIDAIELETAVQRH